MAFSGEQLLIDFRQFYPHANCPYRCWDSLPERALGRKTSGTTVTDYSSFHQVAQKLLSNLLISVTFRGASSRGVCDRGSHCRSGILRIPREDQCPLIWQEYRLCWDNSINLALQLVRNLHLFEKECLWRDFFFSFHLLDPGWKKDIHAFWVHNPLTLPQFKDHPIDLYIHLFLLTS